MDIHGNPIPSTMLLCERSFFAAGRLMALSLIQGGPRPKICSENMYSFLSSPVPVTPSIFTPTQEFLDSNDLLKKVFLICSYFLHEKILLALFIYLINSFFFKSVLE